SGRRGSSGGRCRRRSRDPIWCRRSWRSQRAAGSGSSSSADRRAPPSAQRLVSSRSTQPLRSSGRTLRASTSTTAARPPTRSTRDAIVARVADARPDIVLVGLGAPKQELWIEQNIERLRPAVLVAIGAGIDFEAGMLRRAPQWMSRVGLEWLYRLAQDPRRLA